MSSWLLGGLLFGLSSWWLGRLFVMSCSLQCDMMRNKPLRTKKNILEKCTLKLRVRLPGIF